jgi:hypothetical protein
MSTTEESRSRSEDPWDADHYDDDPREDDCDHDDYESDILTGDATCYRCGHRWIMTANEIYAEIERIRRYDDWLREQERPWNRFKEWVVQKVCATFRLLRRLWSPRKGSDDEIPF